MMWALSVKQPWAWAIMHMGKDVENRTWAPPDFVVGHRIWIHTGKGVDREGWDDVEDICGTRPLRKLPTGAIVGSAVLHAHVFPDSTFDSKWYADGYGFLLRDPIPLVEPIPCKGQLGFFKPHAFPTDIDRVKFQELEEALEHAATG